MSVFSSENLEYVINTNPMYIKNHIRNRHIQKLLDDYKYSSKTD